MSEFSLPRRANCPTATQPRGVDASLASSQSSSAGGDEDSDLAQATLLAAEMVSDTGLDEALGLLWTGQPSAKTLHRLLKAQPRLADRLSATHRDRGAAAKALAR